MPGEPRGRPLVGFSALWLLAYACSLEYLNKNWTYHSKGLWLLPRNRPEALVTIGSPNFGMRSYFRDMESQLYMISESEDYILRERSEGLNRTPSQIRAGSAVSVP